MTRWTNCLNKTSWVCEPLRKHSVMGTTIILMISILIIASFFCRLLRVFVLLMVKNSWFWQKLSLSIPPPISILLQLHWPFLYCRRIIRLDDFGQYFYASFSSSFNSSRMKTGDRRSESFIASSTTRKITLLIPYVRFSHTHWSGTLLFFRNWALLTYHTKNRNICKLVITVSTFSFWCPGGFLRVNKIFKGVC